MGRMRSGCCMVADDASETGANGIAGTADAVVNNTNPIHTFCFEDGAAVQSCDQEIWRWSAL